VHGNHLEGTVFSQLAQLGSEVFDKTLAQGGELGIAVGRSEGKHGKNFGLRQSCGLRLGSGAVRGGRSGRRAEQPAQRPVGQEHGYDRESNRHRGKSAVLMKTSCCRDALFLFWLCALLNSLQVVENGLGRGVALLRILSQHVRDDRG